MYVYAKRCILSFVPLGQKTVAYEWSGVAACRRKKGETMRFIVRASIPNEAGNQMLKNPEFSKKMEMVMGDLRPESVYFGVENGKRTIFMVVNVKEGCDLPSVAEPLWMGLNACVDFVPVMDQSEFAKAQNWIEKAAKKY